MTENGWLSIVSALMVLALLAGGIIRRRTSPAEGVRLGLLWIAIIAVATLAVIYARHLLSQFDFT